MEQNPERHGWRRMAFAVLSMPCEELFGKIESDREAAVALADAAQGIRGYMKSMRALADIIDKAQLRIEMGLCKRDDYEEIFAEAKVEPKARLFRMNTSGAVHG